MKWRTMMIKRYSNRWPDYNETMDEKENGDWVKYDDIPELTLLMTENTDLKIKVRKLEKCLREVRGDFDNALDIMYDCHAPTEDFDDVLETIDKTLKEVSDD